MSRRLAAAAAQARARDHGLRRIGTLTRWITAAAAAATAALAGGYAAALPGVAYTRPASHGGTAPARLWPGDTRPGPPAARREHAQSSRGPQPAAPGPAACRYPGAAADHLGWLMTAALASRQAPREGVSFPALGTTATLLADSDDPGRLAAARAILAAELAAVDAACSRFRADSELTRVNRAAGQRVTVSPRLSQAIAVALRAALLTGGLVDPTVGAQLRALGYDRTFAALDPRAPAATRAPVPAPGWQKIDFDPLARTLRVPPGTSLDLGATAKALAADVAAARCARAAGCGVLVNLGGDLAVAGPAPAGGWRVRVSDDHRQAAGPDATVGLAGGALATSGTTVRAWRRGEHGVHHIVEPASGANPPPCWRTVSVTAATCVDANTASTAAVIMGPRAPRWLDSLGLPASARLVAVDGRVIRVAGWPQPLARADRAMP